MIYKYLSTQANGVSTAPSRMLATLVLTGILSLFSNLTLLQMAVAAPVITNTNASLSVKNQTGNQTTRRLRSERFRSKRLPANIINAIRQDLRRKFSISKLTVVSYSRQNWTDGCLGLGKIEKLCSAAIVPGWRVVVVGGKQRLVYRTNESGSTVILDEATSNIGDAGTIKPTRMSASELPPPIPVNAVFRAIMSGGITGKTYKTTLLNNGQVIRELINNKGISSQHQTTNISPEQVKEFQSLLETEQFSQFDRLNYDLLRGAADNTNVTLTSKSSTTRYDNTSQAPLPQRLNKVIQAWNKIANRGSFGF